MSVDVSNYTRVRYGRVEHIDAHSRSDADYHQPLNSHNEGYDVRLGALITDYIRKGYDASRAVELATLDYVK